MIAHSESFTCGQSRKFMAEETARNWQRIGRTVVVEYDTGSVSVRSYWFTNEPSDEVYEKKYLTDEA